MNPDPFAQIEGYRDAIAIAADRQARAAGKPHQMIKAASDDPTELVAMPGIEVYNWLMANGPQIPTWRNAVPLSSVD